jgi:hypothetical protein
VTAMRVRRRRPDGTVSAAAMVRQLRRDLAAERDTSDQLRKQLDALLDATALDLGAYWQAQARQLADHAAAVAWERGIERGRQLEGAERDASWHRIAVQVATGPDHPELEIRRWGPGGRARFGDPRPGDYLGGPVAIAGE